MSVIRKFKKLIRLLPNSVYRAAIAKGVAAAVEHDAVLGMMNCSFVVDIGANRGQFSLLARSSFPTAKIVSFEPLTAPAMKFRNVFSDDQSVTLHVAAVGPSSEQRKMHVSASDDSSSLLPISELQEEIFPGTSEVETAEVRVGRLDEFLDESAIIASALLKLDVQGFELDALRGCESLLGRFEWIYCECSFVELYTGQKLAADVIDWLAERGFRINGMYNPSYDRNGQSIQADFLFHRANLLTQFNDRN